MTDRLALPVTRRTVDAVGPCPRCGRWLTIGGLLLQLASGAWTCQPCGLALASDTPIRKMMLSREPSVATRGGRLTPTQPSEEIHVTDPASTDALLSAFALIRATINRDPEAFAAIYQATPGEQQAILIALIGFTASVIESRAEQLGLTPAEQLDILVAGAIRQAQRDE